MAKIKVASPVSGIRGTLGGLVFSQNQSGTFARAWSRGANPRTSAQQAPRIGLSTLPVQWRALSQVQRDAWDVYAAALPQAKIDVFGDTYYCSGWNWYCTVQQWRASVGQAVTSTPRAGDTPAAATITALTIDEDPLDTSSITFTGTPFTAAYGLVFLAFAPSSAALAPQYAKRRLALSIPTGTGGSTHNFASLEDIFGTLQESMSVWAWSYVQSTTGRRSAPSTFKDEVQP